MTIGPLEAALAAIDRDQPAQIERLFEWLRIPSDSFDPALKDDCVRAAEWTLDQLTSLGFVAALHQSTGNPVVLGTRESSVPGAPHVLFYGHYDVQPAEPLNLWTRPPFEPWIAEDSANGKMIVARGVSDDKGQAMTFLDAVRGWLAATGDAPLTITALIEGNEESDSAPLDAFLRANADALKADLALVCDSEAWSRTQPAITLSLRGFAGADVVIEGPSRDLHSGGYGGAAVNPIHVLTKALGELHDTRGRVAIPGFYDGIVPPTPELRRHWSALAFDPAAYLATAGLRVPAGLSGPAMLEALWMLPTAEINGITGGYQGPGLKMIIPARASAKVSFRLVPGQEPAGILIAFQQFLRARLPADCRLIVTPSDGSRAIALDPGAPYMAGAIAALADEWGVAPAIVGSGGSIPVVSLFKEVLDMDSLMIGFSLDDDRAHAPNEKYNLTSLQKGTRSWARIIAALALRGTK